MKDLDARLLIAAILMAADMKVNVMGNEVAQNYCEGYLKSADTLIKAHNETKQGDKP